MPSSIASHTRAGTHYPRCESSSPRDHITELSSTQGRAESGGRDQRTTKQVLDSAQFQLETFGKSSGLEERSRKLNRSRSFGWSSGCKAQLKRRHTAIRCLLLHEMQRGRHSLLITNLLCLISCLEDTEADNLREPTDCTRSGASANGDACGGGRSLTRLRRFPVNSSSRVRGRHCWRGGCTGCRRCLLALNLRSQIPESWR